MTTIWKYTLDPGEFNLRLPEGAEFLSAQMQGDTPCMWMLIRDDEAEKVTRKFAVYGTGHGIEHHDLKFLATFQMPPLVWHLFEREPKTGD